MNKNYTTAAIALIILISFAYFYFQYMVRESVPGENRHRLANHYLEDGNHDEALKIFDVLVAAYPDYKQAHLGRALTLLQMENYEASAASFNRAIELDENFAAAYANRGILYDRTGKYERAVADYRKALELDPGLAEGPGWFWRFLRNIPEPPPTIPDRIAYIESELKKPEGNRLLSVPEIDEQQRMYKK